MSPRPFHPRDGRRGRSAVTAAAAVAMAAAMAVTAAAAAAAVPSEGSPTHDPNVGEGRLGQAGRRERPPPRRPLPLLPPPPPDPAAPVWSPLSPPMLPLPPGPRCGGRRFRPPRQRVGVSPSKGRPPPTPTCASAPVLEGWRHSRRDAPQRAIDTDNVAAVGLFFTTTAAAAVAAACAEYIGAVDARRVSHPRSRLALARPRRYRQGPPTPTLATTAESLPCTAAAGGSGGGGSRGGGGGKGVHGWRRRGSRCCCGDCRSQAGTQPPQAALRMAAGPPGQWEVVAGGDAAAPADATPPGGRSWNRT